jgi:ribonuclease P protein component
MPKQFSYNKKEKLKSRKQLEQLFANGKSFLVFPIKVFYMEVADSTSPLQTGVGVGSRHFKKAVDRNRIKRLMREHYRLNKNILQEHLIIKEKKAIVFLLYIDKAMPSFESLNGKITIVLEKLASKF